MTGDLGFVERENIKTLARRQALRDAIKAVRSVPQANHGRMDLIRRDKAVQAIAHLSVNPLVWGGVFIEEGEGPSL
jgi:hypothetical protein